MRCLSCVVCVVICCLWFVFLGVLSAVRRLGGVGCGALSLACFLLFVVCGTLSVMRCVRCDVCAEV